MAKKTNTLRLSDWMKVFEEFAPRHWAYSWDRVGLHVGDPAMPVSKVASALEATPNTVRAALKAKATLLVVHHPLIWKPLESLTPQNPAARIAIQCLEKGLAVYAAHTNWDLCPLSMTRHIGRLLGLEDLQCLLPSPKIQQFKIVVFVPEPDLTSVRQAMAEAGAGVIGNYTECSFSSPGTGTFQGGEGANPALGQAGQLEQVKEYRLEMVVSPSRLGSVIAAMTRVHPYEEVAYDIINCEGFREDRHLIWTGRLNRPVKSRTLATRIRKTLNCKGIQTIGDPDKPIQTLALCAGSGKSLIQTVAGLPVDGFVTGDIDYHSARMVEEMDLTVFDAGHFGTEHFFPHLVGEALKNLPKLKDLPFIPLEVEKDPFWRL